MNLVQAHAFAEELERIKEAGLLSSAGRWITSPASSGLARAGIGAGVGAAGGAAADSDNRLRGALVGAAGGAALGGAAPLASKAGRKAFAGWGRRTAGNQWHGLTGRGRVRLGPGASKADVSRLATAERAGVTSIPGFAKGLVTKPKETLKAAWNSSSTKEKVLNAGLVAPMAIPNIMDRSTREGTAEKAGGTLGDTAAFMLATRMPLVGGMLAATAGGRVGSLLGRGVDKLRGHTPPKGAASLPPRQVQAARMATGAAMSHGAVAPNMVPRLLRPQETQ